MALAGAQYTVFGFDSCIDWKPTVFVDGLPKNRVCGACGLVSATIALLPCHHLLCNRCYDNGADGESSSCPLDKDVCKPEDVIWSTFTRDNLLKRKIQCWNSNNGCDALGAVCEIVDHFENNCYYQTVACCRCKQVMAYKELAGHLENNNCNVPEDSTASSSHGISDPTITQFAQAIEQIGDKLSSLKTCSHQTKELIAGQVHVFRERAAADMLVPESLQTLNNTLMESMGQSKVAAGRAAEELALVRDSSSTIMNTLSEVAVLVKQMKTSLDTLRAEHTSEVSTAYRSLEQKLNGLASSSTEELGNTGRRLEALEAIVHQRVHDEVDIKQSLKCLNERLNGEVCEKLSVLVSGSRAILQNTLNISEPLIWTIEKWSELKKEASLKEEATALYENPKYFYGYSILPGIRIKKKGDLTFHLVFHACQGRYDSLLDWPIKKKFNLHVLDADRQELAKYITINTSIGGLKQYETPTKARSGEVWSTGSLKVTDIEEKECVQDDKVFVKLTVSLL